MQKRKRGREGRERQALLVLRRGNKETVMTINLSKGNKTRLRSCSVPHPSFLWANDR